MVKKERKEAQDLKGVREGEALCAELLRLPRDKVLNDRITIG